MSWGSTVDQVRPHVVKIVTDYGTGTGFLAFYNYDKTWCGIATAAHVIGNAHQMQAQISLYPAISVVKDAKPSRVLEHTDRVIYVDHSNDTAVILFVKNDFPLPSSPLALASTEQSTEIGVDLGWLGFPLLDPDTLCFFRGTVSARPASKYYYVDGVAIHGLSGGPMFFRPDPNSVRILGCVSDYRPNLSKAPQTLPGLLLASDISHFASVAERIKGVDEARMVMKEIEEARKIDPN